MIAYERPRLDGGVVRGTIPFLDFQYGNVWTNIDRATFERLGVAKGAEVVVRIFNEGEQVFEGRMPYVSTFGDVPEGETLLYLNSVDNVAFAINWGNFAATYGIASGPKAGRGSRSDSRGRGHRTWCAVLARIGNRSLTVIASPEGKRGGSSFLGLAFAPAGRS